MKLQRTHNCGELRAEHAGQEVILNGWVSVRRDLGGLYFVDLRDRYGVTQVNIDPEKVANADELSRETVIAVKGRVQERPGGNPNESMPTGAIEVSCSEIEILNLSLTPPFEVKDDVKANEDTRLRFRYVDMRRPVLSKAIQTRSRICQIIREVFHGEDFCEVETPLLMKTSPEGARDFIVPSRMQPGKVYAMPQSPQLMKQALMVSGIDKYFQICKCLRDEDLRADRQPEFTQLDMEMSFVRSDDVFLVIEKTLVRLWKEVLGEDLPVEFPRMSYREAMDRFGIDKPDTRFGLELVDCSETLKECGFQVFSGAISGGGSVRGIRVPGGAKAVSRKKVDKLEKLAKEHGAKGLAWMKLAADGPSGPVAKFLSEDERKAICDQMGAVDGDLLVFVADKNDVVFAALAAVRQRLGQDLDLIDRNVTDVLWICDFPLFEYSEEHGGWGAMHHMFTMPKKDLPADNSKLGDVLGNQYDLVVNGNEMGSGSVRIHRADIQRRIFELIGMDEEEANEKFGWFLQALEYGAPPHGGIALGIDRLVMVMLGYDNIRDVIAFPKNSSGIDPMMDSPSEPMDGAFEELGLTFTPPAPEAPEES